MAKLNETELRQLIHRDLELLVERGRLKGTGQKRARRYELP